MVDPFPDPAVAPFVRTGPDRAVTPLVVAVPHAGRCYPPAIERDRAVAREVLAQLEDRHADRLIGPLLAGKAVGIVAQVARAWIDLNRAETDIAGTASESARARAGLGLIPSRLGGRPLWRSGLSTADVAARIAGVHRPYHRAVAQALAEAQVAFGYAVLIDCHSMPPILRAGQPPRIVVGDRHGASAAPEVSRAAVAAAAATGLTVARNTPYAGAYALDRHGHPDRGIHALQIEIDRSLYLDAADAPSPHGIALVGERLAAIAWAAVEAAGAAGGALAAIAAE